MNVHGIYDTITTMTTFQTRTEYQNYLKEEAGVSGSFLGFYAGVKGAYGESQLGSETKFMALFNVDIYRYVVACENSRPTRCEATVFEG